MKIPLGTMWKISMKLGQKSGSLGQNFTKLFLVHEHVFTKLYLEIQAFLREIVWWKVVDFIGIYNFHVGNFLWIILHHGDNLAQSWEKQEILYT